MASGEGAEALRAKAQGAVEAPVSNQPVGQPFSFSGWTIDAGNPGPGVDTVYTYQCLYDNCPSWNWMGTATYSTARTDIASAYGSTFLNSGYSKTVSGLAEGHYILISYAHRTLDDGWTVATSTPYVYASNPTLTIDRPGAGTGGVTATGLTCTGGSGTQAVPCSALYAFNTAVTLTAVPDSGSIFAGWTGTCSGTSTCAVTMSESKYVAARFVPAAGSSALTFYHTDTIGSVRALTDGSGSTIIRHDYGAFGEDTAAMTGDPIRFGGKELDPETGLENFEARYYRQTWGRFSAVDPLHVTAALTDPQQWNRYAYARNNPLRFTDPTGMTVCEGTNDGPKLCRDAITVNPDTGYGGQYVVNGSLLCEAWFMGGNFYGWGVCTPYDDPSSGQTAVTEQRGTGGPVGGGGAGVIITQGPVTATGTAAGDTPDLKIDVTVDVFGTEPTKLEEVVAKCELDPINCRVLRGEMPWTGTQTVQALRALYPGKVGITELHHVVPIYLGGAINGIKVAIDAAYHQLITNEFRLAWAYGKGMKPDAAQLEAIKARVYSKFPLPPQ